MTNEDKAILEALIDRTSVEAIAQAISQICGEKEQHILSNWQDENLAKLWRKAELKFDKLANSLPYELRKA